MRAILVDDERRARDELRRLLGRHPGIEVVGEAASVPEARAAIEEVDPQLLFLDVQMPGESGFDLLASLPAPPLVVFTTAYDEFAVRAFEVSALDYLLKPVEAERLAATVARVLGRAPRPLAADDAEGAAFTAGTTAGRLARALREEIGGESLTLGHFAGRLNMSARTLHRRLAEEGTSFRDVVAGVRRVLAERHLRERKLGIAEIAFLLGFSEASAFHRAFKRWTGSPPDAYRGSRSPRE